MLHAHSEMSQTCADPRDRVALWPCVVVLLVCMAVVSVLAAWPRTGLPVAVVFPPWLTLAQIDAQIMDAGGALIDFGTVKGVVVARSEAPHFVKDLYDHGALWVLDGSFAASLCVVSPL